MTNRLPNHIRKRAAIISFVGALLAGVTALPAQAALSDCPSSSLCWWESVDFANRWYASKNNMTYWSTIPDWSAKSTGTTGKAVRVYTFAGYLNQRYCLRPGSTKNPAGGLGNGHQWNDATAECV